MPTTPYGTIITNAGAALIADAILHGTTINIVEAAAGDGNGSYYQPTVTQTELLNEVWRGDIASAQVSLSTPNMIDVKVVIGDDVGGFTIREMGLFDEDGTMIAVCNTPDTEKVAISGGVSGKFTMVMHIVVADASVVTFTITPSLDTVSHDDLTQAITDHNLSRTAHQYILNKLEEKVDPEDVYTKDETDEQIAHAVSEHNSDDDAHAGVHVSLADLDNRVHTLELKIGHDVSGTDFSATFETLTGLSVTGVWNEDLARIEF